MKFARLALCAALAAACSRVPENTVAVNRHPPSRGNGGSERLAREALGAFLRDPRDVRSVELSALKYKEASAIRANDYGVMREAARACLWLGCFGTEDKRKDYVMQGLEYANTAVKLRPRGEEGLFYHGAPLSVGDYDKALTHMRRALKIESHWLENQLYMAELEFRMGKKRNDPALTKRARARLGEYFLKAGANPSMAMGSKYEFNEWRKAARKLIEDYE